MSSIGTGYDLTNAVFSGDGRMFQIEYATKAVENGGTAIGIKCKDGVVLAIEQELGSKLVKRNANHRIATVDRHIGMVSTGMGPDSIPLTLRARAEAKNWKRIFKLPLGTTQLANRIADFKQAYTCHSSVRPFGVVTIVAGWDPVEDPKIEAVMGVGPEKQAGGMTEEEKKDNKIGGPYLYMIEPSGECLGYFGAAAGKGRQAAKVELEKLEFDSEDFTIEQGIVEAARIMIVQGKSDKETEIELSWVGSPESKAKGRHVRLSQAETEEVLALARAKIPGEDSDSEEDDEQMADAE